MTENSNLTDLNYGDTPYPEDGPPWQDKPTSNQVVGVEEIKVTSTVPSTTLPSGMIPTGTGGECRAIIDPLCMLMTGRVYLTIDVRVKPYLEN